MTFSFKIFIEPLLYKCDANLCIRQSLNYVRFVITHLSLCAKSGFHVCVHQSPSLTHTHTPVVFTPSAAALLAGQPRCCCDQQVAVCWLLVWSQITADLLPALPSASSPGLISAQILTLPPSLAPSHAVCAPSSRAACLASRRAKEDHNQGQEGSPPTPQPHNPSTPPVC